MRHFRIAGGVLFLLFWLAPPSAAQDNGNDRKQARAARVTGGAITLDGRLEDIAWNGATPLTDFVQKEPVEGAAPTERMEVRIAYDEGALYVGARMFSSNPKNIQAPTSLAAEPRERRDHARSRRRRRSVPLVLGRRPQLLRHQGEFSGFHRTSPTPISPYRTRAAPRAGC